MWLKQRVIYHAHKVLNGKSFIDYWIKEFSEETFCSEFFCNKQHVLYMDKFGGKFYNRMIMYEIYET